MQIGSNWVQANLLASRMKFIQSGREAKPAIPVLSTQPAKVATIPTKAALSAKAFTEGTPNPKPAAIPTMAVIEATGKPTDNSKTGPTGPSTRDQGNDPLAAFNKAYGTSKGEAGYRSDFDFDNDGEINASDYGVLSSIAGFKSQPLTLEEFTKSYGASKGDDNYNVKADLDGDGEVNASDYGLFSSGSTAPAGKSADVLNAFNKAYGSTSKDANYQSLFDFNHDGEIDPSDFGTFSNAMKLLYG